MEEKNLSFQDLLSCSLTTTTNDEYRLKNSRNPRTNTFLMTHNQQISRYHQYSVTMLFQKNKLPQSRI